MDSNEPLGDNPTLEELIARCIPLIMKEHDELKKAVDRFAVVKRALNALAAYIDYELDEEYTYDHHAKYFPRKGASHGRQSQRRHRGTSEQQSVGKTPVPYPPPDGSEPGV